MTGTPHGLLVFHAHPDDDLLLTGGTLAECAALDVPATVVFATRGELAIRGTSSDAVSTKALGEEREREARSGLGVLGVRDVEFLGYRDSGRSNSVDSNNPCFASADHQSATERLVHIIRSRRPAAMTAYDPFGGYGHPDHIQVHRVGTAAYFGAGDAERFPPTPDLPPWQVSALYWATTLRPPASPSSNSEEVAGTVASYISVVRDVSQFVDRKRAALAKHRTQFGKDLSLLGLTSLERSVRMDKEYFILAHSATDFRAAETDLLVPRP